MWKISPAPASRLGALCAVGLLAVMGGLASPEVRGAAALPYVSIEVPPPAGSINTLPNGVNSTGMMVGSFALTGMPTLVRGFVYADSNHNARFDANEFQDVGLLPGTVTAQAYGINDAGVVVGYAGFQSVNGVVHAFSGHPGALTDIHPAGLESSLAWAINAPGQIAGYGRRTANDGYHALRWNPGGGVDDLGTLGGRNSFGQAINRQGWIAGYSETTNLTGGPMHAFLCKSRTLQDLGTLGGTYSNALAINDAGQVVGISTTAQGQQHAFAWTQVTGMKDLGPRGATDAGAFGLNNQSQVVGTARLPTTAFPFVTVGTRITDLNTLATAPSRLVRAMAISDTGYIAAAENTVTNSHAVLLIPKALAAGSPDLTGSWSNVTVTTTGTGSHLLVKISGTLSIKNIGFVASGSSRVQFYASNDAVLDATDVPFGNLKVGPVGRGATLNFPLSSTLPQGTTPAQVHGKYVLAVLDADGKVTESDETNNLVVAHLP